MLPLRHRHPADLLWPDHPELSAGASGAGGMHAADLGRLQRNVGRGAGAGLAADRTHAGKLPAGGCGSISAAKRRQRGDLYVWADAALGLHAAGGAGQLWAGRVRAARACRLGRLRVYTGARRRRPDSGVGALERTWLRRLVLRRGGGGCYTLVWIACAIRHSSSTESPRDIRK